MTSGLSFACLISSFQRMLFLPYILLVTHVVTGQFSQGCTVNTTRQNVEVHHSFTALLS